MNSETQDVVWLHVTVYWSREGGLVTSLPNVLSDVLVTYYVSYCANELQRWSDHGPALIPSGKFITLFACLWSECTLSTGRRREQNRCLLSDSLLQATVCVPSVCHHWQLPNLDMDALCLHRHFQQCLSGSLLIAYCLYLPGPQPNGELAIICKMSR